MNKLKSKNGVTLAELLIVIAIIAVLAGVAFLVFDQTRRSLGQLERDEIAKEIFVAAQNHLTAAYGEGYLGTSDFGTPENAADPENTNYYYTVNGSVSENSVLGQMLPFGSVDETVRAGGSYIIRYQKDTGLVLDVFYCTRRGTPAQYNHTLENSESEYTAVLALRDTDTVSRKADRRNWNGAILGWYGGTEAAKLATTTLQAPTIIVHNEEKLYVEVSNPNSGNSDAKLKLIITGVDSKAQKAYVLEFGSTDPRVKSYSGFTVILDDVASSDMHFGNITADTSEKFIPGEDIQIQAVAYSTAALTNIAYSTKYTTNSLFGSINSTKDTAYIGNIRHLENLDKAISKLDANDGAGENDNIKIAHAEQTDSFSWTGFQKAVKKIESKSTTGTESEDGFGEVGVFAFNGTSTVISNTGYYKPIEPDYSLTYNGKSLSISDVAVNVTGEAGLFGSVSTVTEIKNLELIDFSITGTTSAGALAGTLNGSTVTNVLARNSAGTSTKKITAPTAGGLVGTMVTGTTVQYSAAAVLVEGSTTAGGLVGSASGTITGCYSGGHTKTGSYEKWVKTPHSYDVTGGTVGGLVGTSSAAISDSYSTCSVSGTTAGGFAGNASSGSITNCYATGLVKGTATQFAFIGSGSPDLSGNWYYRTVNQVPSTDPRAKPDDTEPMPPYSGYVLTDDAGANSTFLSKIRPIDLNAGSYNTFAGAWDDWNLARAFDPALVKYYSGRYTLRTVDELNATLPTGYTNWNELFVKTHYGDWPSPEVFFININTTP